MTSISPPGGRVRPSPEGITSPHLIPDLTNAGAERDGVSFAPIAVKLATEHYDSDDGGNRSPPMTKRIVTLEPSPPPTFLPGVIKRRSPDPEAMPSPRTGPKRRRRTKASQADEVVIRHMANHNAPEIAARAGIETLNSASESDMDDARPSTRGEYGVAGMIGRAGLVETAHPALPLLDGSEEPSDDRAGGTRGECPRPAGSGRSDREFRTNVDMLGAAKTDAGWDDEGERLSPNRKAFHPGPLRAPHAPRMSIQPAHPFASGRSPVLRRHSSGNSTLRLPAMQIAPESLSAQSPHEQRNLPPLLAHFADLVDDPAINHHGRHPNGLSPGRPPYAPANESAHSPAPGPHHSRSGPSPPSPSRMNGQLAAHLSAPPPWAPPHEPYRQQQDAAPMSTPTIFDPSQYYRRRGRTIQSDECPTVATEAYPNTKSYRKGIFPGRDHSNPDASGAVFQQPSATLAPMTGTFRCEHNDCKAQPFQTQYLLKSV